MASDPLWYKNAVFYEVDVEMFYDSNGDGVGDLQGLIRRLDYVVDLGVTCLWLSPFYVSPNRDNGYDIVDYCAVDPRLGTLDDFAALVRAAESRGLRVITDLVVNHTSNQHPWFQSARRDLHSPYREYYVWTKNPPPPDPDLKLLFPGVENTTWCYDEVVDAFYWHRFYHHEPDLNNANPSVREEIQKIMGFWLDRGSSGFRVDAAPFMIRKKGIEGTTLDDPHLILREMRAFLSSRRADAVLMAEADGDPNELAAYFGAADEMHLLLNFWLDNFAFLALAREQAEPLSNGLRRLPDKPFAGQWANFLRNLDELDLERLTDSERAEVFRAFAAKARMQIYGRGTRRRLAPMLTDRRRLELAFSLLFTLPGSPVVVYGDEIGLGEDLSLEERNSVRTPMQWSAERNAGFSTASSE
ncbi:MAG: alpha-amylase family protein, partial [Chloroflexi bacterium]|nr:alpha-amylase family protein [Chloroflexota bacterium]